MVKSMVTWSCRASSLMTDNLYHNNVWVDEEANYQIILTIEVYAMQPLLLWWATCTAVPSTFNTCHLHEHRKGFATAREAGAKFKTLGFSQIQTSMCIKFVMGCQCESQAYLRWMEDFRCPHNNSPSLVAPIRQCGCSSVCNLSLPA